MSVVVEATLKYLTQVAWASRTNPVTVIVARKLTGPEQRRPDKMRAIVDDMHQRFTLGDGLMDADDACVFVAGMAMSVGIPCRLVGVRYGQSWTCWVQYEVDKDYWETIDPLRQKPGRDPDETMLGPLPEVLR